MSINVREDIANVELAQKLGFKVKSSLNSSRSTYVDYNPEAAIPHNLLSFEIGNVVVWVSRGGWKFAQLIEGYYCNHSDVIPSLQTCLWAAKGRHERSQSI